MLRRDGNAERAYWKATARHTLASSAPIEAELVTLISRPQLARYLDPAIRAEVLGLLFAAARRFNPRERVLECRNPGDNKVLELCLAADAAIVVASEPSLLALRHWRGTRILSPATYLALKHL